MYLNNNVCMGVSTLREISRIIDSACSAGRGHNPYIMLLGKPEDRAKGDFF